MLITVAVLFAAGARIRDFLVCTIPVLALGALIAVSAKYRVVRLTSFLDPWRDPYNTGFQLTQSLIAIGSGEWTGLGLGGSVQKLFYLPEAHTDFVFAVIAEEFGLLGSVAIVALFSVVAWRALTIARQAAVRERWYQASVAFGFAVWQAKCRCSSTSASPWASCPRRAPQIADIDRFKISVQDENELHTLP